MDPETVPQPRWPNSSKQAGTSVSLSRRGTSGELVKFNRANQSTPFDPADSLQQFWLSCCGSAASQDPHYLELTVADLNDSGKERVWRFTQPVVVIGRARDCDLRLERREVSRRHAYLQLVDGRWMCVDLGSGNGVRWPQGKQSHGWLDENDVITIGPYQIKHARRDSHSVRRSGSKELMAQPDFPEVYLDFLNGKNAGPAISSLQILRQVTLIGGAKRCKILIEDPSVAEFHASLVLTAQGLWVVNLVDQERTRINGAPIRWQQLLHGSELSVGRFRFRVRYEGLPSPGMTPATDGQPPASTSGSPGISEAFVLGLMSQMAAMQQQFMEHSQQQMLMTAQLLASMKRPEPEVNDELLRVQGLTQELQSLCAEMTGQLARSQAQPNAVHFPEPETSAEGFVSESSNVQPIAAAAATATPPANPEISSITTAIEPPTAVQAGSAGHAGSNSVAGLPPQDPGTHANGQNIPADPEPKRTQAAVEMHSALIERMARLERERNSSWNRIVSALTGKRL